MRLALCDPLMHLLTKRQERIELPPYILVWAIYGVPPAMGFAASGGEWTAVFVAVLNICLMLGLPLYLFQSQFSLLLSLRKGRCFEEMISSGFLPQQVVDTLALQSFPILARLGVLVWPLLVIGSLLTPFDFRVLLFPLSLIWPLLMGLVAISASYVCQALILRTQTSKKTLLLGGLLGLGVCALGWMLENAFINASLALVSLAGAVFYARHYAIDALSRPDLLAASSGGLLSVRGYRNRWLPSWSDNAIVSRERARTSSVGGSVSGFVLLRMLTIVIPAVWGFYICVYGLDAIKLGWPLVAGFLFLRSALITVGAVVGERIQKTWEPLVQSGLDFGEFRRGWLALGTLPVWLESVPIFFVVMVGSFFLVERTSIPNPILGAAICAMLVMVSAAGAHLGLAISSISDSYRQAISTLLARSLRYGIIWLAIWGALYWLLHAMTEHSEHLLSNFEFTMVVAPLLAALAVSAGIRRWSNQMLAVGAAFVDANEVAKDVVEHNPGDWWPMAGALLATLTSEGSVWLLLQYAGNTYYGFHCCPPPVRAWEPAVPSLAAAGLIGWLASSSRFQRRTLWAVCLSGIACLLLNRQLLSERLGFDPLGNSLETPHLWVLGTLLGLLLLFLFRVRPVEGSNEP